MFSFFSKKNPTENAFAFLGTDMHAHLVPGVDDGSDSIETSLKLIAGLEHLGFKKLIITPHIYETFYKNSEKTLRKPFDEMNSALATQSKVETYLSAEYFVDEAFEKLVANAALIPFPSKHILVEISLVGYNPRLEQIVFDLVTLGYTPILAHPERYLYLSKSLKTFQKLKDMGCEMQCNINSLGGYYGKASEEMGWGLIGAGLVNYLGTDMHHTKHLEFLSNMASQKKIMDKLKRFYWKNSQL